MGMIADMALIWLDEVYHVGHLDPALKRSAGIRLEGSCFSVSSSPGDGR